MEATCKDIGDHKGPIQNPCRKKVCGRPYCLFGLQNQGGRAYPPPLLSSDAKNPVMQKILQNNPAKNPAKNP